jgi:hypothetical protein
MTPAASALTLPGRVALRTDSPQAGVHAASGHVSGMSVFDNLPPVEPVTTGGSGPSEPANGEDQDGEPPRASALRRLIGSLRRR